MQFRMKKARALTQAALEQRILVFCKIVNCNMFLHVSTLERWERRHMQLSERH